MAGKYALFAFNGEAMCFVHVLLNALDLAARGHEVQIVVEGAACGLVPKFTEAGSPLAPLWRQARDKGLVAGVCRACAAKLGTLTAAEAQGLPLLADMQGHAGMGGFLDRGFTIITF